MIQPPLIAAARAFRNLVLHGDPPSLSELARGLEELVLAAQDCPDGQFADIENDPPKRDYKAAYSAISARFPNLGYYGVADPLAVDPPGEPMLGDAIDDLTDIVRDLEDGLWRLEANGAEDALWHLRCSYTIHWGRHARELALYLHAVVYG